MTDALTEAPRGASTSGPRPTPFRQAWAVAQSGLSRAAVIGAGSMGAGIAAQFANAGVPVDLLDIPADKGRRDARAEAGSPLRATRRMMGMMEDQLEALHARLLCLQSETDRLTTIIRKARDASA